MNSHIQKVRNDNFYIKSWELFKNIIKTQKIFKIKRNQADDFYRYTVFKHFFDQCQKKTLKNNENYM